MKFSTYLRKEANPLFQKIYEHPYVQGLKNGKLQPKQLIHYVQQDHQYLQSFIQVYALAISKSSNREDMDFFNKNIQFILHSETHPHRNLAQVAGVDHQSLTKPYLLAPSAQNYMNHMLITAHTGTLADIYAAILPCPWTYVYIAETIQTETNLTNEHPFYEWITFYTKDDIVSLNQAIIDRLDEQATAVHPSDQLRLRNTFLTSCYHELCFWDMAYTPESYPFSAKGV